MSIEEDERCVISLDSYHYCIALRVRKNWKLAMLVGQARAVSPQSSVNDFEIGNLSAAGVVSTTNEFLMKVVQRKSTTSWFRVNSDRRRLYQYFVYVHLVLYFYEQKG